MYFWNIKQLKTELQKKSLSESDSFKYLFVTIAAYSIALIPSYEKNIWDTYSAIIAAIITTTGLYYAYRCNKGKDGTNFLQKYLSLGWVVTIRWSVFVLLPLIIAIVLFLPFTSEQTTAPDMVLMNLAYVGYFWMLGKHMKEVA
jgi:hypothetical protein